MRITGLVRWKRLGNGLGLRRLRFLSFNSTVVFNSGIGDLILITHYEPVFLNVYGAQESIPRNEFRQPM
jgi:hypothetical protein